jgi:Spy/CpxP family protein refolding chaperone
VHPCAQSVYPVTHRMAPTLGRIALMRGRDRSFQSGEAIETVNGGIFRHHRSDGAYTALTRHVHASNTALNAVAMPSSNRLKRARSQRHHVNRVDATSGNRVTCTACACPSLAIQQRLHNMKTTRTPRPVLSSLVGGALVATSLLASALSAQQGPPPQPPRAGARMGDSQPPRRQPGNPDMRGAPGAPGRPSPDMMPGMMPRMREGVGPDMQGMQGMQGARGRQGGPGMPAAGLIGMRQQLGLTDDQVRRLEALRSNMGAPRNEAEMMRAQADLMEATRGDVNMNAARAALERINRIRVDEELAALKARQDIRNVLTAEQKSRLDAMRQNGREAMGQGRGAQPMRQGFGPGMGGNARPGIRGNVGPDMRGNVRPGMGQGFGPGNRQGMSGSPRGNGFGR